MSTKKKVNSYVKQVLAQFKGDTDKAVAERNYRKGDAAVRGQLSSLESSRVDAEIDLADAKEALVVAKYPTTPITDSGTYLTIIVEQEEAVSIAEGALKDIDDSIEYFKGLSEEFNKEE